MLLAGDKPKNSEYTFQLTSIFRPPPSNLGRRRTFVALWWARAKENESPSTFGALRRDSWRTMKVPAVCLLFFFFFLEQPPRRNRQMCSYLAAVLWACTSAHTLVKVGTWIDQTHSNTAHNTAFSHVQGPIYVTTCVPKLQSQYP